jgi:hypothetical protein
VQNAGVVVDSLTGTHNAMMKWLFVVNKSGVHKDYRYTVYR